MSVLADIVNAIVDIQNEIEQIRATGIYQFFTKWFAEFIKWSVVGWYKFKLQALTFAWDVAQEILTSLNISSALSSAFSHLDSRVLAIISFLRIPEAVNIIMSAYTTRLVLSFMGF